jgi:hypothetical protein
VECLCTEVRKRLIAVDCNVAFKMSTRKKPEKRDSEKRLLVDRAQFEGIVKRLIHTAPVKRDEVKPATKKPHKIIPPEK